MRHCEDRKGAALLFQFKESRANQLPSAGEKRENRVDLCGCVGGGISTHINQRKKHRKQICV